MGVRLSTAQKGICHSLVNVLFVKNVKFFKGGLKRFICVLFLHFTQMSPESVNSVPFWDAVEKKFFELARSGDTKAKKFMFWLLQIRSVISAAREVEKGHKSSSSRSVSPSSSPHPRSQPSSPKVGILKGAASKRLPARPGSPQVPRSPCPSSLGQTARDSCSSLGQAAWESSLPQTLPVNKPCVRFSLAEGEPPQNGSPDYSLQNGREHMAQLRSCWSLSSPQSSRCLFSNPFPSFGCSLPPDQPLPYPDTSLFPQTSSSFSSPGPSLLLQLHPKK